MRYTITNQGYSATIDSMGAELKSFKDPNEKEYVWYSDPEHWMRSSPLLFPTIGNVRNNKTIINGQEYPMEKHGFCKDSEFQVIAQEEHKITFSLSDNENTHKSYPFSFELRLTYTLNGKELQMTYEVYNKDTQDMIYHIGAHPGFNCPLEENEVFSDYILEFDEEESMETYVYDLDNLCFFATPRKLQENKGTTVHLNAKLFDQDALYFYHTNSHGVTLKNPETGKGIRMDYPDFASIAFWTPIGGKAPFLCLEPWNGSGIFEDEDDNFASKRDIQTLAPQSKAAYELKLTIL